MTAKSERLLNALESEITNVSKLEHALARTRSCGASTRRAFASVRMRRS